MLNDSILQMVKASRLTVGARTEIVRLCNEAYGEDLSRLFAAYTADWHVLARLNKRLVGHAMIVARWLQAGNNSLMQTAYVEFVATSPSHQGKGIGSAVMRNIAEVAGKEGYEVAALCPADTGLYTHLGWEFWQGDLFIRPPGNAKKETPALIPTPEERVMILRLPGTPSLDLGQSLSAEWREGGELW